MSGRRGGTRRWRRSARTLAQVLVDAGTLAAIGTATGAEFDRKAAACLREHLEQLASLARSELSNGTSAPVKDLARQVADSRSAGLAALPSPSAGPSGAAGGG